MHLCENQTECGFFAKHGNSETAIFPMLVSIYCRGPLRDDCMRWQFLEENGRFPSHDMAPTGLSFSD